MTKKEDIRRYTSTELNDMIERGEDRTDWARVMAKTEEDLARDTASDPAWDGIPEDWYKDAVLVIPQPKKLMSLRLDSDIVEWFRSKGPGYQTRINAVLRSFIEQDAKRAR